MKIFNLKDLKILKALLLLEMLTGSKSYINYLKKNYKEINFQFMSTIQQKNSDYLLLLLRYFYLPILHRRHIGINQEKISKNSFNYTLRNINFFPFLSNVYFK